jgi:hypothetical protein
MRGAFCARKFRSAQALCHDIKKGLPYPFMTFSDERVGVTKVADEGFKNWNWGTSQFRGLEMKQKVKKTRNAIIDCYCPAKRDSAIH